MSSPQQFNITIPRKFKINVDLKTFIFDNPDKKLEEMINDSNVFLTLYDELKSIMKKASIPIPIITDKDLYQFKLNYVHKQPLEINSFSTNGEIVDSIDDCVLSTQHKYR